MVCTWFSSYSLSHTHTKTKQSSFLLHSWLSLTSSNTKSSIIPTYVKLPYFLESLSMGEFDTLY